MVRKSWEMAVHTMKCLSNANSPNIVGVILYTQHHGLVRYSVKVS